VTGSEKVEEILRGALTNSIQLITHEMAFILMRVIEENHRKTTTLVREEVVAIEKSITDSLGTMGNTIDTIKGLTGDMSYLAMNAQIEAAKAGDLGRGFDIVAQQVEAAVQSVRDLTQEIAQVNSAIMQVAARIESSLVKLE
jgi:methyl-accepting chemotaxis protein